MKNIMAFSVGVFFSATLLAQNPPQLKVDNIDEVIAAMTLEEKVHLCIGTGMDGLSGNAPVIGSTRSLLPGTAGTSYPVPRLGIPAVILSDGPAGLRIDPIRDFDSKTYYCTHFPIGTALSSTWNVDLVRQVGNAIGEEVLEYGSDVLLAPALNIHRHPLCGRNFEYYSEDPLLSGKIAAAYVEGVQRNGVGTSVKHFVANNQETNRNGDDVRVSQRAMREIYLKGFEIVVKEADPWTLMTSYNKLNGTYTSERKDLLTDILRNDWGYQGMVMTDWFGGKDAVAQMEAGNEMLQPGRTEQYEDILNAVKEGRLDEGILDRNVKRILQLILKTPHFKGYKASNKPDLQGHAALTRQSAAEGMVLLKNDAALPMPEVIHRVGAYGCTSYDIIPGGTGSGNVNSAYTVSLIEGLRNAGYVVDKNILARYQSYAHEAKKKNKREGSFDQLAMFAPPRLTELVPSATELQEESVENDIALVTIGRISGEFIDRSRSNFKLTDEEAQLIEEVCNAYHNQGKKVVVVLNIGGVIETKSWDRDPDAILCAWQVGQEGGNSIVDVLSGKQSPSGKLPMTFPINVDDAYSSKNFPMDTPAAINMESFMKQKVEGQNRKNIDYTDYEEDIYVGYRYFDTFGKAVAYPFGFGLSYTTFGYSGIKGKNDGSVCKVSVKVANNGKFAGKEAVQLYVTAPKSKLNKPAEELKAFGKTGVLQPGESQVLTLSVPLEALASFSEKKSAWVVDSGAYVFKIGASSRDMKGEVTLKVKGFKKAVSNSLKSQEKLVLLK